MGFGKDGKGLIIYDSVNENIGALAGNDTATLTGRANGAMAEDFRMIKLEYWMSIAPAQAVVILDGPAIVGIAHGSMSAAAIEATLESIVTDQGSLGPIDDAMKPVWPLESFIIPDADSGSNDTLIRKGEKTIRWTFNNPDGWVWWVHNNSAVSFVTGNTLNVFAKIFGVWVT